MRYLFTVGCVCYDTCYDDTISAAWENEMVSTVVLKLSQHISNGVEIMLLNASGDSTLQRRVGRGLLCVHHF